MFFFSEFFFSILPKTKPQSIRSLSDARFELVDDDGDWRELHEDGFHRLGVLASQMMKIRLRLTRSG
jgi:hypothetical protein